MTFEERMEYLRQSIESHDRQIGELTDQMGAWGKRAEAFDERLNRFAELTQLNFDRLTKAMTGLTNLVANHERRIGKLEEGHAG
ncbi:MAG TPA: hypothetical protein VKB79_23965 [Bryobacteraceae bacterium]|nr:hypothetical protein [Bryobacteraceae bacterium]